METDVLPVGNSKKALDFPHFPTRHQCVIWRNWGLVPVERIAGILHTDVAKVKAAGEEMGLVFDDSLCQLWQERGFISIIRRNWHLLPYEQLLELLGWDAEKLAFTLREDDFLWAKMGSFKPECEPVFFRPLSAEEREATVALRECVDRYFADIPAVSEPPFSFLQQHDDLPPAANASGKLRLAYAYAAVYGDPLLHPELDPYTDEVLAEYAACGINALWLQGTLYTLVPWLGDIPASKGWEIRQESLRRMCERAAGYGIEIILYTNEPRAMDPEFYASRVDWKGADTADGLAGTMCMSEPAVVQALEDAYAELFAAVPGLGGVFIISMSENLTHCISRPADLAAPCPRCAARHPADIVAQVNAAIAKGVHRSAPDAKVIAFTWGWEKKWDEAAVEKLPHDVWLMCVSETAVATEACGIKGEVLDYSISKPGPGPTALRLWKKAQSRGLRTVAKVQLNNSWELSAVPFLPVADLVEEHIGNLRSAGISDFMLSWTLGGYPGGNFELMHMSGEELAKRKYGSAAGAVLKAWKLFSDGFREFPFHFVETLYCAPQNYGPANLLFGEPTGYTATMVGFPYDDLLRWRGYGHYPEEVLEKQFRLISEKWYQGLQELEKAQLPEKDSLQMKNFDGLCRVARAAYTHFRSTWCQIRFVQKRNSKEDYSDIIAEEISLAVELAAIVNKDSRIGFEASNHYYYTINDLKEKVINAVFLSKC